MSVVVYLSHNGRGAPQARWAQQHCMASQVVITDTPSGDDPRDVVPAKPCCARTRATPAL